MQKYSRSAVRAALSVLCLSGISLLAQTTLDLDHVRPVDRVRGSIDENARVTLTGDRSPLARTEFDTGRMAPDAPLDRIQLLLQADAGQQQALAALLAAQQDPQSPYYHQWLTPEEFGSHFGISDNDLRALESWLQSEGLAVEPVPAGRGVLVFSGTVGQVESAFHTEMHTYLVNGRLHHANATDPQVPAALAPVIGGVVSLHDFASEPLHLRGGAPVDPRPDFTSGSAHYLAPADFAAIYDLAPLYNSSTDGAGYAIAIAGRSNITLSDVQLFRSQFSLPTNNPQIIVNGTNPGLVSGDVDEATLDVEWSGAVAPNATIELVVSASTASSDGVALSSQYIVNHNLAPVVSSSYGSCEAGMGAAGNQFWNALWQQAAAQGMSVFVAAGDSGAAGCDSPSETVAVDGQAVNGLCSSPYSTCVGGTEFNDTADPSLYWSSTNNSSTFASALSYIPETAWNESSLMPGGSDLWAGGGGSSIVYSKPSWQTGVGVPAPDQRYVPDVALSAAGHDGYLVALEGQFYVFSGTSAATPSFAGITTLAVQRQGAWQGNANPILYALAARQANGGSAVFHDVTTGNNSVNGVTGFSADTGYDPVTGWGSVDANQLINAWASASKPIPSLQISAASSATSITQGASGTLKVTVSVEGGFNAAVTLSAGSLPSGLTASFSPASLAAPGSGTSSLALSAAAQMTPGSYNLTLTATGGGISQSVPLAVTIVSRCSFSLNPSSAQQPAGAGSYTVSVTDPAGCSWTAVSNSSWITVTKGASGAATSQVSYSLTANAGGQRTGTLTIAGLTFTVTQASGSFSLNPTSASIGAAGGSGAVTVTAPTPQTTWTATSNVSWITIASSSASLSGSASVSYSVAPNTATTSRTGTLTIAGLTFTVTQAGLACNDSLKAGPITAASGGASVTLYVTAPAGCSWTAVSDASWITISSGASGEGNGTVVFAVAADTGKSSRTGTLVVAGYTVTVTEGTETAVHLGGPLALSE